MGASRLFFGLILFLGLLMGMTMGEERGMVAEEYEALLRELKEKAATGQNSESEPPPLDPDSLTAMRSPRLQQHRDHQRLVEHNRRRELEQQGDEAGSDASSQKEDDTQVAAGETWETLAGHFEAGDCGAALQLANKMMAHIKEAWPWLRESLRDEAHRKEIPTLLPSSWEQEQQQWLFGRLQLIVRDCTFQRQVRRIARDLVLTVDNVVGGLDSEAENFTERSRVVRGLGREAKLLAQDAVEASKPNRQGTEKVAVPGMIDSYTKPRFHEALPPWLSPDHRAGSWRPPKLASASSTPATAIAGTASASPATAAEGEEVGSDVEPGAEGLVPIDCVIPCHDKDREIIRVAVQLLRRHAPQVQDIYIISASQDLVPEGCEGCIWVNQSSYPLVREYFTSWTNDVYQQLLKLLFWVVVPSARRFVLVCDADTLWLRDVTFVERVERTEKAQSITQSTAQGGAEAPEAPDQKAESQSRRASLQTYYAWGEAAYWDIFRYSGKGYGYAEQAEALLGESYGRQDPTRTAVCHHQLLDRQVLEAMFKHVRRRAEAADWNTWMGSSREGSPTAAADPSEIQEGQWQGWKNWLFAPVPPSWDPVAAGHALSFHDAAASLASLNGGEPVHSPSSENASDSSEKGWNAQLWSEWMVFIEVFQAHATPRSLLAAFFKDMFESDEERIYEKEMSSRGALHAASEYEVYQAFAFASWAHHDEHTQEQEQEQGQGQQQPGGALEGGTPAEPRARRLNWADVGSCCFLRSGEEATGPGCSIEDMHHAYGTTFGYDFVTCHAHLRPSSSGLA